MEKQFYTVNEFADRLNFTPATIRSWIRQGRIFAIKLGEGKRADYRIDKSEIDRLNLKSNPIKDDR